MLPELKLLPEELNINVPLDEHWTVADESEPNPPAALIGQARAQSALEFGIAMTHPGYNIFMVGEPGLGRLSLVTRYLANLANSFPTPPAYCYVDNFSNPKQPIAVQLPSGQGQSFCADIEQLVDQLLLTFPATFENPSYQRKKSAIERTFNQRYNAAIEKVENKARGFAITLFKDNENVGFAPIVNNKPLTDIEFSQLPENERQTFSEHLVILEDFLGETLAELPQWRRQMLEQIKQLDSETINQAIAPLLADLEQTHQSCPDAYQYLLHIKKHLTNTITEVLSPAPNLELAHASKRTMLVESYVPNILVDHADNIGAPVLHEAHPIYQNLFGSIEYSNEQGALTTNFRRICAGALHKANGGFLILDAEKVLAYPFVWESLKRALQTGRIEIDAPTTEQNINPITLKPQDMPLNIKIILVGSAETYYALEELDNEFKEIFKILADFDSDIPLTQDSLRQFASLMQKCARSESLDLSQPGLHRLLEHSCRQAEQQTKLSAHINDVFAVLAEAGWFAKRDDSQIIEKAHIQCALDAREFRNGRLSQLLLDEILDGTVLIATEGSAIGKINGLTILEVGGSNFGVPTRITATVYPGSRGIVDIEREAELGQSIHTKGVMILTGYLGNCYAQQFPLAISANIAVEQSYGHIDGDSAALAELCCLISALTRIPIHQSFAVTGSINQYGEVQAIGGINDKIEGFFRVCQARGLTGQQAVIIPAANKRNLVLNQSVIEAIRQGKFAIYAVSTVAQTLELLTGVSAGMIGHDGHYPENSINAKAIARLKEIADIATEDDKEASE